MDGKEPHSAPEDLRSDLFTGGLGEKKNVKGWVKSGESTAEAKELALTLQAKMEAIKKETNLKLVQEYRYVFDELIMSPDSYDAKSTTVDDVYKNKGLIYVLEKNCPVLAVQFQTYPDLRYLVYANLTKQVPDVDVLPMNSTVSMVDGMIQLSRPGKPDVSFKLFPWDYREAVEARYQALKPAPEKTPEAVAAPAPEKAPEPEEITSDYFKEEDDLVIPVGSPKPTPAPAPVPETMPDADKPALEKEESYKPLAPNLEDIEKATPQIQLKRLTAIFEDYSEILNKPEKLRTKRELRKLEWLYNAGGLETLEKLSTHLQTTPASFSGEETFLLGKISSHFEFLKSKAPEGVEK